MEKNLQSITILGVRITTAKLSTILKYIEERLEVNASKVFIVTPNPEMLVYATKHPGFKAILNHAQIALPDGVGISIGAWVLGHGIVNRISGADMLEKMVSEASKSAYSIGLFGGMEGVAESAADCLRKKYPGVKIIYTSSEFDLKKMKSQKIDILFVALGHPKQEDWIYQNLNALPIKIAMGVGGSFDYLAGNATRAPKILRSIGLEWLYRLIRQPWRWRRQLALIKYIGLIIQEILKSKKA